MEPWNTAHKNRSHIQDGLKMHYCLVQSLAAPITLLHISKCCETYSISFTCEQTFIAKKYHPVPVYKLEFAILAKLHH